MLKHSERRSNMFIFVKYARGTKCFVNKINFYFASAKKKRNFDAGRKNHEIFFLSFLIIQNNLFIWNILLLHRTWIVNRANLFHNLKMNLNMFFINGVYFPQSKLVQYKLRQSLICNEISEKTYIEVGVKRAVQWHTFASLV